MADTNSPPAAGSHPEFLNECTKLTPVHYRILGMSWAGWVFDFYDLILFTFLMIPIAKEYNFSNLEMSYVLGTSLAATAVGGVIFGILSDRCGGGRSFNGQSLPIPSVPFVRGWRAVSGS